MMALVAVGAQAQELPSPDSISPAQVYFQKGKLHFRSNDGRFHLWMDNRVNLEAAVYSPTESVDNLTSKLNKDLENDDGQFRFSNGVIVRRARLGLKAELDNWFAELDVDFAFNEVELKDMFLGYRFNDHWNVRFGNFQVPMSM